MKRTGRAAAGAVPAFFTRSRAKNFFNSPNAGPKHGGNRQHPRQRGVEQFEKQQEHVMGSENTNSQAPKQNAPTDQANQQQTGQQPCNETQTASAPPEVSATNQNSEKDSRPESFDEEMKFDEQEQNVQLTRNKNVSATGKALQQMQEMMDTKKNWKKKQKVPLCIRRRKLNQRLNKILMPKSGLIFLHELKPGCSFKIQDQPGSNPPVFLAQVEYNGKVLAVGQGMTKPSAKNAAAENAIKALVAEALTQQAIKRENVESEEIQENPPNDSSSVDEPMDASEDLSLAGLASFAMYKMFTEWQSQGTDFPLLSFQPKKKPTICKTPPMKKELPPNADKLHPSFLLNTMRPGILSTELERSSKDNISSVTMGYEIDGKMYKGSGSNKKEARKRAAQAALSELYGLKYED